MRSVLQLRASEGGGVAQGADAGLTATPGSAPAIRFRDPQIEMAHGAGGKATRRLVDGLFVPLLYDGRASLYGDPLSDAARVAIGDASIAITTDSFVVTPLMFPGGSIGELAVHGTINDLAVSGALPVALVTTFVLEAGLPTEVLAAEVQAMGRAARAAGVAIVGGDTKVVEHGKTDRLYITTTGLGRPMPGITLGAGTVRAGDRIILSGPIGDHGITILLARGELDLEANLRSDTRSVFPLVQALVTGAAPAIRWMRDPTRGGVATSLNELALDSGLAIHLYEDAIPVRDEVRGACELLGLDPLHIANEGQFLAVVAPELADRGLEALRAVPGGGDAVVIGEVREEPASAVLVTTRYGGSRIVDMLVGDPLPRIC
jgi:hydrogenase expression/formation protein HypE